MNRKFFPTLKLKVEKTGAVLASTPFVGRAMARYVPPLNHVCAEQSWVVIELGAGTGAVTQELVSYGICDQNLILVESMPEMAKALANTYPRAVVRSGDAYTIHDLWMSLGRPYVRAIVSTIPIAFASVLQRRRFLEDCLSVLPPGAPLIQMTYKFVSPIKQRRQGLLVKCRWVPANVPPASIWRFSNTMVHQANTVTAPITGDLRAATAPG